ncbi:MAG: hypothetical protein V7608_5278 [Hyphomicrobiales bacterium]
MQDVASDRTSPTEDGFDGLAYEARRLQSAQMTDTERDEAAPDYLRLMREARQRGQTYYTENLQGPVDTNYRAFRNKHFAGSKYWSTDYRNRSKLFRPKTRSAVRKANAAAISALFSSTDAVKCSAGDDSNPQQKANAALTQELFNYRTDRTSGQAAIPWFRICGGAHQDAMLQSACISKQYWKLELRAMGEESDLDAVTGEPLLDEETGAPKMVEVYKPFIDRPDVMLFPLENIVIDPAANWLSPIQSAAFFMARVPMSIDEVMQMQHHPLNPWKPLTEAQLRSGGAVSDYTAKNTRQQREGIDRLDNRFTGTRSFEIVWVYEVFIRWQGEDICFWAAGDQHYLTDPKPVREVYPEQGGERPYTFGVINLESHRLFPMSPVESWQQGQVEINDFANLTLDVAKLSVAPVTKVKRGQNVDLGALSRRGPQSQILVNNPDDVTWDRQPGPDGSAMAIQDRLSVDFDDQAGQFNSGSVQTNRSLNETVGGLRLISGAANAVSEFDLRVWIETWTEPTIAQIVKLLQYYEDDQTILALCGGRAKLFEKFGVSEINDELLQQQIKVRVDAGVGNADPEQKLAKLQTGLSILMPLFANSPQVASGELSVDLRAIADEVFGLCGQRDGAAKFIKAGEPKGPDPSMGLQLKKLQSEIDKNQASAKSTIMSGLAAVAKVDLGGKQLEADQTHALVDAHLRAVDMGHQHGHRHADALAAQPQDAPQMPDAPQLDGEGGAAPAQSSAPGRALIEALVQALQAPRARRFQFERGPDGRLHAVNEISGAQAPPQAASGPMQQQTPQGPPQGGLLV